MQQGDKFNLRVFHHFVWKNGNVPIALQQWEYLGREDELSPFRESEDIACDKNTLSIRCAMSGQID